ncbi:fibroblast growth factor-binding protein 2 [Otolemur garnettii]|uniref:Fibroblast growth factor binding protein 2 n=1 Tax=Otolemur garnettii TaxID=30611 RepID=H0XI73_OTOGA|nr:fibroblast growth factor-binding protein 2 [Otolemur garnettii]
MEFFPCLLLLALSCLGTWGQAPQQKQGRSGEEFHFQTGGGGSCTMRHSSLGPRDVQLLVHCQDQGGPYWCKYSGQPGVCQAFVDDPQAYWDQALRELRLLSHPCLGAPVLRPPVCQVAGPQAHMRQVASSLAGSPAPEQHPKTAKVEKPPSRPGTPAKPSEATQWGENSVKKLQEAKPTTRTTVTATPAGPRSAGNQEAEKAAWEHCWKPLQALCAFLLRFFQG